ncbi:MAG TPA: hypothetical protein VN368_02000 [Candidatus Methylomirabilis sp.]|nr:hypothetical protein [Candidatus Methylomirabilis sp.]
MSKNKTKSGFGSTKNIIKLGISLIFDYGIGGVLAVFPVLNEVISVINTVVAYALWGNTGLLAAWEILNPVEPLDAFVPSVTIAGIISLMKSE